MKNLAFHKRVVRKTLFLLLFFIVFQTEVHAQVTPDGTGTVYVNYQSNGNGSSWANALKELSDAVTAAQTDNNIRTIRIAQGTYYPTGIQNGTDRNVSFQINRGGLKIYGGYNALSGQRNILDYPTILSGNIGNQSDSTDNSFHVMVIGGLDEAADSVIIDGLTIRDGLANGTEGSERSGGGVVIENCENNWKVAVRNCIFTMNAAINYGGGLWVHKSELLLSNSRVENNRAEGGEIGFGGGLALMEASGELRNSTFLLNSALWLGGAILSLGESKETLRMFNCILSENSAHSGGAVMSRRSTIQFSGTEFHKNAAEQRGGVICIEEDIGDSFIDNCTFSENASEDGGGIYNSFHYGSLKMSSCTFLDNTASNLGGAVFNRNTGDNLSIESCEFRENTAYDGGAMANMLTFIELIDCEFYENNASSLGGAIYNQELSESSRFLNCKFEENAAAHGGAVLNIGGFLQLEDCEFSKNNAINNGGAILSQELTEGSSTLGCKFQGNTARNGGAVYNVTAFIEMVACEFYNNEASQVGGAIINRVLTENSRFLKCKFQENSADTFGGGIAMMNSFVYIEDCEFIKNKSLVRGGALFLEDCDKPKIVNCAFKGNEAVLTAGAIQINKSTDALVVSSVISGNYSADNFSALFAFESNAHLVNCTFVANNVAGLATLGAAASSTVVLTNSVVLFNGKGEGNVDFAMEEGSSFTAEYGVYYGVSPGGSHTGVTFGNGLVDYSQFTRSAFRDIPDFNTAPTIAGDFRPAANFWNVINKGNNSLLPAGITTDIGGRPRIHRETIDFGAYEYQGLSFSEFEIYVDQAATGDATGTSWVNAARGLKEALFIAEESTHAHTIHVGEGIYYPTEGTDRDAAFLLPQRSIRLLGGYDPATGIRNPATNPSVLSGDIGNPGVGTDNSYHVLVVAGLGADSTIIDGFIIRDGQADGSGSFSYNGIETFRDWGGGLFVTNDTGAGTVMIRNCIVAGNSATDFGGGVVNYNTSLVVSNSLFHGNLAGLGGGLSHVTKDGKIIAPQVIQSTFAGNMATFRSGGVDNFANSQLSFINTLIYANSSGVGGSNAMTYTAGNSLIQGRSGTNNGNLDGTVIYPEMFVDAIPSSSAPTSLGDYRLTGNSPAVDKGSNPEAAALAIDLSFRQRIVEGRVDMGAYEFYCQEDIYPSGGIPIGITMTAGQSVQVGTHCSQIGRAAFYPEFIYTGGMSFQSWMTNSDLITHGPARFVRRYHAISAAQNISPVRITLYYSNADFKAYNASYGIANQAKFPDIDDETPILENLRIAHYPGKGSGDFLPETYPTANQPNGYLMHVPLHVTWNEELGVWEVTFESTVFSGFFITGQSDAALPVNLVTFKAECAEEVVQLHWQTTEEKGFSHFQAERSYNGQTFVSLGTVLSGTVSESVRNYYFVDYYPLAGINYYRLKMVDADGSFSYSSVVSIQPGQAVYLYPNPSPDGKVGVRLKGGVRNVKVYDPVGKQVQVRMHPNSAGGVELDFQGHPSGVYLVEISDGLVRVKRRLIVD